MGPGAKESSRIAGSRRSARLLLLGFLVLACLIAAAGYWIWAQQAATLRAQAQDTATAVAHSEADEVSSWLAERRADAAATGADPWLAEAAAELSSGSASVETEERVRRRLASIRDAYRYAAVLLLSTDGRPLSASPAEAGGAAPARTRLLAADSLRSGKVEWSDLYRGEGGRPTMEFAAPLSGSLPKAVPGVIVLVSDPRTFLYPAIQDWPVPSASGETLLVERRGDRVLYLNDLRFREDAALRLSFPLTDTALPAVKAVEGNREAVDGIDYRGVPVYAAAEPVPGTGWHVIAKLDRAEVVGPIRARGILTAGITALLVALTGLVAYLLWRSREAQVEAELLRGERRYRSLLDNLSAGVVVHAADTTITFANARACELLGLTLDQLTGKTAVDPYWRFLHEDGSVMPHDEFPVAQVLASGEPLSNLVVGTVHTEGADPVWALCNAFPQRDPDGEITEVLVTFVDVTARVLAERRLRTSERRFRETVELLDEGYFSTTQDGLFIDYNPSLLRIFGLPPDTDLRGRTSEGLWWDPEERLRWIAELRSRDAVLEYVTDVRTPEGERRTVVLSAHVIRDAAGTAVRTDGSATDITGLRRAQREIELLNETLEQRVDERTTELDSANRELESFAYSVSHDLRAPLRHISGFSSLLAERAADGLDEKSRHYLDVVIRSVNEMGVLIDDLLQFSRTGRAALKVEPVDMDVVVQEALAPLQGEADGRDIRWSIAPLPAADADRALIRQVWMNLLGNAIKYTGKEPVARIEVGGREDDGESVYWVADNGVGFDMEYAHKLFGVFQRLHDAGEFEGTGIGLANVHRIVTRLHGRVWAEGETGKGATFSFSLPATKEAT